MVSLASAGSTPVACFCLHNPCRGRSRGPARSGDFPLYPASPLILAAFLLQIYTMYCSLCYAWKAGKINGSPKGSLQYVQTSEDLVALPFLSHSPGTAHLPSCATTGASFLVERMRPQSPREQPESAWARATSAGRLLHLRGERGEARQVSEEPLHILSHLRDSHGPGAPQPAASPWNSPPPLGFT